MPVIIPGPEAIVKVPPEGLAVKVLVSLIHIELLLLVIVAESKELTTTLTVAVFVQPDAVVTSTI
jgi:hypothetical protein